MLNPQQQKFKEAYINPESATFGNQTQSALAAGYTQEYAESIGCKDNQWMAEIVGDLKRLQKAERVLDEILDTPTLGDPALMNAVGKVAMFTAESLGKKKYAKRNEHTGPDGKELPTPILAVVKE